MTNLNKKERKALTFKNADKLPEERQKVLNGFESRIFPIGKQAQEKGRPIELAKLLKILTPKQMFQRLLIALVQVKAGSASKNLLNETR